jgi:hypothetical protein
MTTLPYHVLQVLSAVDKVFGEKAFDTFQLK